MVNYFNNANTNVTVRKYGTKYGKKIEDADLVPVKKRGTEKEKNLQALTEAANRFAENTAKVNERKLGDLKERRLYEKVTQEGNAKLKDDLLKDVMRQVCVESLLVDEDVVLENINIINNLVDTEVDSMGGYQGLKTIAKTSNNQLLENMVEVIENMSQKVGLRALQESTNAKDIDFTLNDDEVQEFDLKKQELGVEAISDFVKERVLTVVQNEQKANQEKSEVMDEIKSQLQDSEADVPVEEAMEAVFGENVEHVTLFESLLRTGYKGLLETSSSAIFESSSFNDDEEEEDDEEYSMKDIEIDNEISDEMIDVDDEDLEELVFEEGFDIDIARICKAHAIAIFEAIQNDDIDALQEELDSTSEEVKEVAESCKSKSKLNKVKESVRKFQTSTEEIMNEACKSIRKTCKEEVGICPICGEEDCTCDTDEVLEEGIKSFVVKIKNKIKQISKNMSYKLRLNSIESSKDELMENAALAEDDITELLEIMEGIPVGVAELRIEAKSSKYDERDKKAMSDFADWMEKDYKEYVTILIRKHPRGKSINLESANILEEASGKLEDFRKRIQNFFEKQLSKAIAKRNFDVVRKNLVKYITSIKTKTELDILDKEDHIAFKQLNDAKLRYPESAAKIDEHINWLQTEYPKLIKAKRKELEAKAVKESFDCRMNEICDMINNKLDRHDAALTAALESVNVDYDGNTICAPLLSERDCNLPNMEFAYKTKVVCESLKNLFSQVEDMEETKQIEEMVNINLQYIAEAKSAIADNYKAVYKYKTLTNAEKYLNKITHNTDVLTESFLLEGMNTDCTEAVEEVRNVYETLKNDALLEGTNDDFMEVVLAEAIVKYTIMESFSTLNLIKFSKDEVEQMSRKNIQ